MQKFWNDTKKFVWEHRGKITIGAIAVAAIAGYVAYSSSQKQLEDNDEDEANNSERTKSPHAKSLIKINKQFEIAAKHFLPTLQIKIIDIIDISENIRKIKELRSKPDKNDEDSDFENELWEEIKISSFALIFVTTYMSCALTVLLKTQLHIIARTHNFSYNRKIATYGDGDDDDEDEIFNSLIEKVYSHLFSNGLINLVAKVKCIVKESLMDFLVQEKISVMFEEFIDVITKIRNGIEINATEFLAQLILPPDAMILQDCKNSSQDYKTSQVVAEVWDVVESPMFAIAFTECVDICFRHHFSTIRGTIFTCDGVNQTTRPPLASLLPHLKAISARMLPQDNLGNEVKDIMLSPSLDSLCISILNSV